MALCVCATTTSGLTTRPGLPAALVGKITIENGRVEHGNFDTYEMQHMRQAPAFQRCRVTLQFIGVSVRE